MRCIFFFPEGSKLSAVTFNQCEVPSVGTTVWFHAEGRFDAKGDEIDFEKHGRQWRVIDTHLSITVWSEPLREIAAGREPVCGHYEVHLEAVPRLSISEQEQGVQE